MASAATAWFHGICMASLEKNTGGVVGLLVVGLLVGAAGTVGRALGTSVAFICVGAGVGHSEIGGGTGASEGITVGDTDGPTVSPGLVGWREGMCVGTLVGNLVGSLVGTLMGDLLGEFVSSIRVGL